MKKVIMLLSLFSVVGIVANGSTQKESLQEEREKAGLAMTATKEHKNQVRQNLMCRDIAEKTLNI